jgi:hypothetical protein
MEAQSSLSCSQKPASGPSPEPDESSPHLPTLFPQDTLQYYPSVYAYVFRVDSSKFPEQNFVYISHPRHACYMPLPPQFLTLPPHNIW